MKMLKTIFLNLARTVRYNIGQVFQILRVAKTALVLNWPRSNLKCFLLNHAKIFCSWFYTVFLLIYHYGYNGYMVR